MYGPYSRALKGRYGHEQESDEYETAMIKRKQEAATEKDEKGYIEYNVHGGKNTIEITKMELKGAGLDPRAFEWKSLEQVKEADDRGKKKIDIKKEIAEADKETGITRTDLGGIKALINTLINKIKEFFKGKGEK